MINPFFVVYGAFMEGGKAFIFLSFFSSSFISNVVILQLSHKMSEGNFSSLYHFLFCLSSQALNVVFPFER